MFNLSAAPSSPGATSQSEQQVSISGGAPSPPVPPPYHVYFAAADSTGAPPSASSGSLTVVSAPHQFSSFVTGSHVILSQPSPHSHQQPQQQVQLVPYGHPALSVVAPTAFGFHSPEVVSYSSPAQTVVLIPSGTSLPPPSPPLALPHLISGTGPSPPFLIAEQYHRHHVSQYPQSHPSAPFSAPVYVPVDAMDAAIVDQGHGLPPATPGTEKNAHGLVVGHTYEGTIKRYNPWRGFGFVRTDGGVDIFLHHSGVQGDTTRIVVGARARFEVALVGGHRQAVKLQLLPPRKVE